MKKKNMFYHCFCFSDSLDGMKNDTISFIGRMEQKYAGAVAGIEKNRLVVIMRCERKKNFFK